VGQGCSQHSWLRCWQVAAAGFGRHGDMFDRPTATPSCSHGMARQPLMSACRLRLGGGTINQSMHTRMRKLRLVLQCGMNEQMNGRTNE
jgi:hypothetical protein